MKATKGPWNVLKGTYDGGRGKKIVGSNDNPHYTITSGTVCDDTETIANAHLIAAAPNLIKVLKMTKGYISKMVVDDIQTAVSPSVMLDMIDRVINEAEGKETGK